MPVFDADAFNCLPPRGFVREFVLWAARQTGAPAFFHFNTALSLLAAVTPLDYKIRWFGDRLYATWWGLNVGSSGSYKTHAISMGIRLLERVDRELIGADSGSDEGLKAGLNEFPQQLIAFREFGEFLAKTSGKAGYAQPMRSTLTACWDNARITRKLKNEMVDIPDPRLSLLAGVTVPQLERYTQAEDWSGGFMARWCVFLAEPERDMPQRGDEDAATEAPEALVTMLRLRRGRKDIGTCFGLTAPAAERLNAWSEATRHKFRNESDRIRGSIRRAPAMAMKAAMLYAFDFLVTDDDPDFPNDNAGFRIGLEPIELAIRLIEAHLTSIVEINAGIAASMFEGERRTVLRAVPPGIATSFGAIIGACDPKLPHRTIGSILEGLVLQGALFQRKIASEQTLYARSAADLVTPADAANANVFDDDVAELVNTALAGGNTDVLD